MGAGRSGWEQEAALLQLEGLEQEQTPGKGNFPITPTGRKAKGKWSRRQEEFREGWPGTTLGMCGMVQGSLLSPGQLG